MDRRHCTEYTFSHAKPEFEQCSDRIPHIYFFLLRAADILVTNAAHEDGKEEAAEPVPVSGMAPLPCGTTQLHGAQSHMVRDSD